MLASPKAAAGAVPWWSECRLAAGFIRVHALVPSHHGVSLRPFARGRARPLPHEIVLQATLLALAAGHVVLLKRADGSLALEELWTRSGRCREQVVGRLLDEALLLAREAGVARLSIRPAREDREIEAALRSRGFVSRQSDEGELVLEVVAEAP